MSLSQKIYRKIRYPINDILFRFGAEKKLLKNRPGKRILAYHGVDSIGSLAYNTRFISETVFEQQISYFKNNFHIVSLNEYYEGDLPADKLTIALTFDDGYANNYTRVLPILEKYQVPATFFITAIREKGYGYLWNDFYDMLRYQVQTLVYNGITYKKDRQRNFVSQKAVEPLHLLVRKFPFGEIELFIQEMINQTGIKIDNFPVDYHLQMTTQEISRMAQSPFVSIGAHSYTHMDMTKRPLKEAVTEMKLSKQWLEEISGQEVDAFAFPYGAYNHELIDAARTLGYRYILPVTLNRKSDSQIPELQNRFGNNPFLSLKNQVWCILNDCYL